MRQAVKVTRSRSEHEPVLSPRRRSAPPSIQKDNAR